MLKFIISFSQVVIFKAKIIIKYKICMALQVVHQTFHLLIHTRVTSTIWQSKKKENSKKIWICFQLISLNSQKLYNKIKLYHALKVFSNLYKRMKILWKWILFWKHYHITMMSSYNRCLLCTLIQSKRNWF
jgi:hypothetical protein